MLFPIPEPLEMEPTRLREALLVPDEAALPPPAAVPVTPLMAFPIFEWMDGSNPCRMSC